MASPSPVSANPDGARAIAAIVVARPASFFMSFSCGKARTNVPRIFVMTTLSYSTTVLCHPVKMFVQPTRAIALTGCAFRPASSRGGHCRISPPPLCELGTGPLPSASSTGAAEVIRSERLRQRRATAHLLPFRFGFAGASGPCDPNFTSGGCDVPGRRCPSLRPVPPRRQTQRLHDHTPRRFPPQSRRTVSERTCVT